DILIEDKHVLHHEVPWHLDPESIDPVQIEEWTCRESFDAPDDAIFALETFLAEPGAAPPWKWVKELYEDGLVDADFALTPRGARRLGKVSPPGLGTGAPSVYCVVVADGSRARVLTLESDSAFNEPTLSALKESADISNPQKRARDSERFENTRPGIRR